MQRIALYIILVSLFACRSSKDVYMFSSFREPGKDGLHYLYSYDGYKWDSLPGSFLPPSVGKDKIMRDPSIVKGPDGTFHLVWTTSWKGDKGFGYSASRDLQHWSPQQFIPAMEHEPSTVNVWAPELFYDDVSKQFIIIWASCIPERFEKGIEAADNNHRMYYTVTKDFKTFSPAKLFLDPGFSVIDAVIVKTAPKAYTLVLKDNTRNERNLKIAFAESPLGPYSQASAPFTGKLTEGPTVLKPGKEWLIYFDDYGNKRYGAVATTDFRHFKDINTSILVPEGHKHGTVFKVRRKILDKLK
ncbi:glycoside hydrolase family 43 protein [Chitinophaga rhizophila]|uniref:Glycoside hydrolase family 43 protein n=1 Tax=Chitinophaga rhizophila TaxID=2866212 RepID=A0ABS7G8Z0_9BACT|nr:glycoside hydrolase family 43 protein [Chitinophaga rhizophila]MBW8684138.1 glycoside hydrolase family 43 protein [Chitinophaga rhizophila]